MNNIRDTGNIRYTNHKTKTSKNKKHNTIYWVFHCFLPACNCTTSTITAEQENSHICTMKSITKFLIVSLHTIKTNDRATQTPLKTGGELKCSRRVGSSCSICGARRWGCKNGGMYRPGETYIFSQISCCMYMLRIQNFELYNGVNDMSLRETKPNYTKQIFYNYRYSNSFHIVIRNFCDSYHSSLVRFMHRSPYCIVDNSNTLIFRSKPIGLFDFDITRFKRTLYYLFWII
jgi:hypothetical protein